MFVEIIILVMLPRSLDGLGGILLVIIDTHYQLPDVMFTTPIRTEEFFQIL